jgi:CBS domain-containing protein
MASELRNAAGRPDSASFVYFSQLLGQPIADAEGQVVGRLWDLSILLGEPFPAIQDVLIRPDRSQVLLIAAGSQVASWTQRPIRLSANLSGLRPSRRGDRRELRLRDALLDKQVVDVAGAKVERVNDLHLLLVARDELRLAHIDVGLRGLVRRLGWESFVDGTVSLFHPKARYLTRENLIGWNYIVPTLADPAGLRLALSQKSLGQLHPADLAELLEELPADSRRTIFAALELDTAARVLSEVEPVVQEDLLALEKDPEKAADLLETMPPDAAADVLAELPPQEAENLLARMQPEDANNVSSLMNQEEGTAGGLMTTEIVALPGSLTVEDAFVRLRGAASEVEFLYQIYVVDDRRRLLGYVTMRRLFLAKPSDHMSDIMAPWSILVHPEDSTSDVAGVIERYNLAAVPVVDGDGVLLGMITVDDLLSQALPVAWKRKLRV